MAPSKHTRVSHAGIDVDMGEVLLLASRFQVPGARYAWAARLLWPALLRDLAVAPGGALAAGAHTSIGSLRDLVATPPRVRPHPRTPRQPLAQHAATIWPWIRSGVLQSVGSIAAIGR